MGRFHPDPSPDAAVAALDAKLHEKELELLALKARYDQLCRRFRSNVATMSTLSAAQSRRTVQPDLCRKCMTGLMDAFELEDIGEEPVSMARYLPALARTLLIDFDSRIRLATSVDPDLLVDFRRANCIGLIYAEAVSNALKHAFPGLASGSVHATLRANGKRLELTVGDCGLGFDPEAVARRGDEGLSFMRGLADQIRGELRIATSQSGTIVRLTCPA